MNISYIKDQLAEINEILERECTITQSMNDIIKKMKARRISVLCSVTGSGKTTAVPFKIYQEYINSTIPLPIDKKSIKILCIVPSRAICMCMYNKFKNIFIGIKMKDVNINPNAPIIYITYGTLSKIYDKSKNYHPNYLDQFSVFLWDEAHEIINMKLEKLRVRSIIETCDAKHMFMSATFTQDLIESALKYKFNPDSIITFNKESRKYKIIDDNCGHLLSNSLTIEESCLIAYNYYYEKNIKSLNRVIIFLPTISSGMKLKSMLERLYDPSSHTIVIINSELEPNELENVFALLSQKVIPNETIDSNRIIVITTSFLNSGVTIANAQVIDSGLEMKIIKNSDFTNIRIVKSSESTTIQRRGRTGRTSEGFYMNLNINSNMTNIIYEDILDEEEYLHMIFLNLIDVTKPRLKKILLNYEAINSDNTITQLGEQSIKCNIHPKFMKLIDISNHFMDGKYTWLIIAIIVFLDIDKLFNNSEDENIRYRRSEMLDTIRGDMLVGAYLYSQTFQYTYSQICSWYGIYKKKFIFACNLIEKIYLKLSITNFGQFNSRNLIDIIVNSKLFKIAKKYDSMYFDYPTEPIDIQLYQKLPENILDIICKFVNPTIKEKGLICPFIHHTSRDLSHSTNSILYSKLHKNTKGRMILSGSISLD